MQTHSFLSREEATLWCSQHSEQMYRMKWLVCWDGINVTAIEPAGAVIRFQCRTCVEDGWVAGFDSSIVY